MTNFFDINDHASTKDLTDDRIWDLGTNKIHARRTDPYGFWHIHFEKGAVPQDLSGAYTTFDNARQAVEDYVSRKGKDVKSLTQ